MELYRDGLVGVVGQHGCRMIVRRHLSFVGSLQVSHVTVQSTEKGKQQLCYIHVLHIVSTVISKQYHVYLVLIAPIPSNSSHSSKVRKQLFFFTTRKTPAYKHLLVELPLGGLVNAVRQRGGRVLVDQPQAVYAADRASALRAQPTVPHRTPTTVQH